MKRLNAFLVLFILLLNSRLMAQPGALDINYGTSGVAAYDFAENNALTYATLIQPDGKAILAGNALNNGSPVFAIARFNNDGSPDSTFGSNGGGVTTNIDTSTIYSVALQPMDGGIVVAGFSQDSVGFFALARYTTNGVLDFTFGTGGIVTTSIKGIIDIASAVAVQPDGKILAGGISEDSTGKWYLALARYLSSGLLDAGFNGNGTATTFIDTGMVSVVAVMVPTDNSIIMAGNSITGGVGHPVLVRYTSSGSVDNSFGDNGMVNASLGQGDNRINSAVLQQDGKIVVGGYAVPDTQQVFAMARFNANGTLDNSFGTSGVVLGAEGMYDNMITSLVLQPDKKIIATGSMDDPSFTLVVNRYQPTGSPDSSFGTNGVQTSTLFAPDTLLSYSSALQPDGNLVVSGAAFNGNNLDFAASRFLTVLPATCNAFFTVYPDANEPHHYFAYNQATGVPPLTYEWSWGDGSFSFGDTASHIYSEPNYFYICLDITDSLGCASSYCNGATYIFKTNAEPISINVVNTQPAGVDDLPDGASVNVYPNPTGGKLMIQCENFAPELVTIYDINGNKLAEEQYTAQENLLTGRLDISALPAGIYLLEMKGSDGIAIRRVVKE